MKWKREQFSAITRNCRSDGKDFLLGVRRDKEQIEIKPPSKETERTSASVPPELASRASQVPPPRPVKIQRTSAKQETSRKESAAPNSVLEPAPPASVLAETADMGRINPCHGRRTRKKFSEPYNSSRRSASTRSVSTCRRAPTPRKESYAVQRILSPFRAQTRS